jgi:uncharacterized protein (TIGR02246 family)
MNYLGLGIFAALSTGFLLASCNQGAPAGAQPATVDTRAADEAAIRATDVDWARAAADKDAMRTASYYQDNALLLAAGGPVATGREAIQKAFTGMIGDPQFALTFAPSKVVVSKGGDMAYEIGDYSITFSGPKKGRPATTKAVYVVVWGKQADGTWKALVDAPTTATN